MYSGDSPSLFDSDQQDIDQNQSPAACRGFLADDLRAAPAEMVVPAIAARMEQWRHGARDRINSANVWTFMAISERAAQRQILQRRAPQMLPRTDVIWYE